MMNRMTKIIGCAYRVYNKMGFGFGFDPKFCKKRRRSQMQSQRIECPLAWKIHKPRSARRTRRKNEDFALLQLNIFVTFVLFVVKKVFWSNFTQVSVYKYVATSSR